MDHDNYVALVDRLRNGPRETTTVEFKSNWDRPDDIGEYISALANASILEKSACAWMIWGVDDPSRVVKGTAFDPFSAKGQGNQPLIMWLTQQMKPKADFDFHEISHPDGRVVVLEIHVPRSSPLAFKGVRYIRLDSHKTALAEHPDKEARIWGILSPKDDWTGKIIEGATLEDLDADAIKSARMLFLDYLVKNESDVSRHSKLTAEVQEMDVGTLLNKARITKGGKITRSAILLLGSDESAHFLAPADAKITWSARDAENRVADYKHFGIPLLLSTDKVFKKIRNASLEHLAEGTLFPNTLSQYDPWVIREALHNCVAHQDYQLGGKINVVEHPSELVFTNLGTFIPQSVEWMLNHQSPPEHYRNQWLIDGMIRLRMIDQAGSGIRRMFETQRDRFFPLPDYSFEKAGGGLPGVEVTISGKVLDVKYTQALINRRDLSLREVILLDRVQKRKKISDEEFRKLKQAKLVEGRKSSPYVASTVANSTDDRVRYILNRAFNDSYYRELVMDYLSTYQKAQIEDIRQLVMPKLPDVLSETQKLNKIRNLMQAMRAEGLVFREGTKGDGLWRPVPKNPDVRSKH